MDAFARSSRRRVTMLACVTAFYACTPPPNVPTVESCAALPAFENHRAADAVPLPLRFENQMGRSFEARAVCISIDGRSLRQEDSAAVTAGFEAHRPLEMQAFLRPGVSHQVVVVTNFAGRGALNGYRFSVAARRELGPADLRAETLAAVFLEVGGPDTPPERRPTVEWTGPGRRPAQ